MPTTKTVQTLDGQSIEYIDEIIGSGTMKDVYFTTDGQQAVAFFKEPLDANSLERLQMIVGSYHEGIFNSSHGDYWRGLFCWPSDIVKEGNRYGVLLPKYDPHYFFEFGSINDDFLGIKGGEKEGKWFSTPTNRFARLDKRERGDWRIYLRLCLIIARAVRRMHSAGLAHSDLSYKNVLISPSSGDACIIDVDGLVVPGKFPPDVVGTPDFIAPEVVATAHLSKEHPDRVLPSRHTDRHALAVLIYQYLLLRHPLRGKKIHDFDDPSIDETLAMGQKALFVEHPHDNSNRIDSQYAKKEEKFWQDTLRLPYTITGPYLSKLIEQAFIDGLHDPHKRPTADDWERALIKTVDLIQPCDNAQCIGEWYVFDNKQKPRCPFCDTPYHGKLPVINLYSDRGGSGKFMPDNHRIMIYKDQSLFAWHISRDVIPNERLEASQSGRVGYCIYHNNNWLLVNEKMEELYNYSDPNNIQKIEIGKSVALIDGLQLVVKYKGSTRLLLVQLVEGS
jgi:serine/threonine protein kinase